MDVETEARRAALDFFVSLLRDVATFFPETGGAAAAAAAEVDADVEAEAMAMGRAVSMAEDAM